jgi:hypothetical protein
MQLKTLFLGTALTLACAAPGLAQQPPGKPAQGGAPAAMPAKPMAGAPAAQTQAESFDVAVARRIDAAEVKQKLDAGEKIIILDTRAGVSGPVAKGAEHVTYDKIEDWAKTHKKDALIVAYCT